MEVCTDFVVDRFISFDIKKEKRLKEERLEDELELEVEIKGEAFKEEEEAANRMETSRVADSPRRESDGERSNQKTCGVCSRDAKRSHFGAVCCDSCRAFFRRSVQNRVWETFMCFKEGRCDVKENRRSCQFCRFKRCQFIGMDKSLVMTEEDRKALMSRKLERRRQIVLEHQRLEAATQQVCFEPGRLQAETQHTRFVSTEQQVVNNSRDFISNEYPSHGNLNPSKPEAINNLKLQTLQNLLRKCLSFGELSSLCSPEDNDIIENIFVLFCKGMGKFFNSVPEFLALDAKHQRLLLKPAVAKALFIIGTHQYDAKKSCWPRKWLSSSCNFPRLSLQAVECFIDDDVTMFKWKSFISKFSPLYRDEVVMLLALLVALFDHNNSKGDQIPEVQMIRVKYLQLLEHYLHSQGLLHNAVHLLRESFQKVEEIRECFLNSTTKNEEQGMCMNNGPGMRLEPKTENANSLRKEQGIQESNVYNYQNATLKEELSIHGQIQYLSVQSNSNYSDNRETWHNESTMRSWSNTYSSPDQNHEYAVDFRWQPSNTLNENRLALPGVTKPQLLVMRPSSKYEPY